MKRFVVTSKGDDKSNAIKTILDQYLSDFDLVMDEEAPDLAVSYTHLTLPTKRIV